MTISFNTVRTNLYNWAVANVPVGMPVIYYYQNAPRPTVDYVTLYITSTVQIGRDFTQSPLTTAGTSAMIGDREFTLQIQAYGGDPITILENLRTSLQIVTVLDSLRAQGLVYVDWLAINDITDLINSRYEQRASMDLRWRIAQQYTEQAGAISTANVHETYFDSDGSLIISNTITIPPT